jgi:hypothetical protein
MLKKFTIPAIILLFVLNSSVMLGSECVKCHMERKVKETVPQAAPLLIKENGKVRNITLKDAFGYHSHSCPGVTTTFLAIQYGIKLLYGNDVPDVNDLVILSRSPAPGSIDMIDFLMINKKGKVKTSVPEGMKSGRDKFFYTVYSKSKATAVDVQLKPELYPEDFFKLKKKQANNTMKEDEWQTLHDYMKDMITSFPTMSFEDLFGNPQPYMVILWGSK